MHTSDADTNYRTGLGTKPAKSMSMMMNERLACSIWQEQLHCVSKTSHLDLL